MTTNNEKIKNLILDKIREYDSIIVCRHFRPDGDAIGSTKGLCRVLKDSFPNKKIYLINDDSSEYLSFLGGEDEDVDDTVYASSLGIVLDTATIARVSNKKIESTKELIKIDHHIDVAPYGDISWVEEERSSLCELIADFCFSFPDTLKVSPEAAYYIYTGMVTDSGRFKFSSTSGETLRLAAKLLDLGIDTETLFANLYLSDFDYLKSRSSIMETAKITENGVAYLHITSEMKERFDLSDEDASNTVSLLESIKGSIMWLAFIDMNDGTTRVRLRSRFMTVNKLAEKYHGGGHDKASGAYVYSPEEMASLLSDADALIKEYKENNEGWL